MSSTIAVHDLIRRSNRNTLLLTIVGILILAFGVVMAVPYWLQTLTGPHRLTAAEVMALPADSEPRYNVIISGEEMFDVGYTEYTENEDGVRVSTDAYFGVLLVGEKFLLVRSGSVIDDTRREYTGTLLLPTSISLQAHTEFQKDYAEAAGDLLPLVLDAHYDTAPWLMGAAVLAVLLVLVLIGLYLFITRSANHAKHPIMKGLARFGDVEGTLEQINGELLTSEQKQSFPGLSFTRNWLVYTKGNTFEAAHLGDIMWVYKQSVRTRYGTNFFTHLYDRHGRLLNIQGKEQQVNEMIGAIIARAPWAIGGYSEDIKKAWNSDRQRFIATVDGRRQQTANQ